MLNKRMSLENHIFMRKCMHTKHSTLPTRLFCFLMCCDGMAQKYSAYDLLFCTRTYIKIIWNAWEGVGGLMGPLHEHICQKISQIMVFEIFYLSSNFRHKI